MTLMEDDLPDDAPDTPRGRNPTLPTALGGMERIEEFNPMLELFGTGEGRFGVDTRSEVTDLEALQFSRGRFLADYFHIPELNNWIDSILRLKISRHRKSREEAVNAVKAMHGHRDESVTMSLLDRLRK